MIKFKNYKTTKKIMLGGLVAVLVFPRPAEAIVILPAVVLIPIAKLVAVVIGGLSLPAVGIGAVWQRMSGAPKWKVTLVVAVSLLVLAVLLAVGLQVMNPERPWV
jgi:hypothetical protein